MAKNKGDTLDFELAYTVDGEPIVEGQFAEIEFSIGPKRYTLTDGDITWDNEIEKYILSIGQADSFALGGIADYQIRFKTAAGKVISSSINKFVLGGTISKTVI